MLFEGSILRNNPVLQSFGLPVWEGGRNVRYQNVIVLYNLIVARLLSADMVWQLTKRSQLSKSGKREPLALDWNGEIVHNQSCWRGPWEWGAYQYCPKPCKFWIEWFDETRRIFPLWRRCIVRHGVRDAIWIHAFLTEGEVKFKVYQQDLVDESRPVL